MAQQAQNEFYKTPRETALAYAKVVREEVEDLFAAGADVVQLDEPYMQARPDAAREFGIEALDAALQGITGKTCVHICFGYAALIHERPEGYSFLPEFADSCCNQLSIETAQSNLDCSVLKSLQDKEILLGVIDLSSSEVESPEIIKQRVYKALEFIDANKIILAPDCGMKYLPRESAFKKLSNMVLAAEQLRSEYA
jgi:5-methyltetrahydropteroyltriglutamate--homocysteine methyltransferase